MVRPSLGGLSYLLVVSAFLLVLSWQLLGLGVALVAAKVTSSFHGLLAGLGFRGFGFRV